MSNKGVINRVHAALMEEGDQSSEQIAKTFLKMNGPVAGIMVDTLLKDSPLFEKVGENWRGVEVKENGLNELSVTLCYPTVANDNRTILSLSIWELNGGELTEKLTIARSADEIGEFVEESSGEISFDDGIFESYRYLARGRVIFFSHFHQRLVMSQLISRGLTLSEEATPVSQFFRVAKHKMVALDGGLINLAKTVMSVEVEPIDSYSNCKLLGELTQNLLIKIGEQGINSAKEFDRLEEREVYGAKWSRANFLVEDILLLDEKPGVYGFKNGDGEMIYVGKAKSLRRRLLTYFRVSDESPAKLTQLREEAVDLIHHSYGSELEALIMENKLIKSYSPKLNRQLNHFERAGEYRNIPSSIFILPATETEAATLLLFGEGDDIIIKTVECEEVKSGIDVEELDVFFYKKSENREPSSAKMICERWLLPRLGEISRIEADNCESSEDMLEKLVEAVSDGVDSGVIFR